MLVWVFVTHFGYGFIEAQTGVHRAVVFYVMMGIWTALLCGFIQTLLWSRRGELAVRIVLYAAGIGAIEGLLMLCLLAGPVPQGLNACDHISGLPITVTSVSVYLLFLAWSIRRK